LVPFGNGSTYLLDSGLNSRGAGGAILSFYLN
jgi:hypothetical protein